MMSQKKINMFGLVLLIPPLLVIVYAFAHRASQRPRIDFRRAEATQIVDALQSGTLKPDANGIVTLPNQWRDVAKDGRVYVTRDKTGIAEVLFATYRNAIGTGTDADFGGYIYSRAVLQAGDPATNAGPQDFGWMPLVSPQPLRSEPRWPGTAGRSEVFVCRRIDDHWYEACTENTSE
jgi:hypothetical protein